MNSLRTNRICSCKCKKLYLRVCCIVLSKYIDSPLNIIIGIDQRSDAQFLKIGSVLATDRIEADRTARYKYYYLLITILKRGLHGSALENGTIALVLRTWLLHKCWTLLNFGPVQRATNWVKEPQWLWHRKKHNTSLYYFESAPNSSGKRHGIFLS